MVVYDGMVGREVSRRSGPAFLFAMDRAEPSRAEACARVLVQLVICSSGLQDFDSAAGGVGVGIDLLGWVTSSGLLVDDPSTLPCLTHYFEFLRLPCCTPNAEAPNSSLG